MTAKKDSSTDMGYVECDENDNEYFGAKEIVDKEKKFIRDRWGLKENEDLGGIALSGGGIRSASFSLGVLQGLAYNGILKHIHYLSTVSGGGYIGSSITWLLSKDWLKDNNYGIERNNFPYGTYLLSGNPPLLSQVEMLRFLRQHTKYLTPGDGINIFSLIAVILRGTLLSLLVYVSLLVLVFIGLKSFFFEKVYLLKISTFSVELNLLLWIAAGVGGIFILLSLIYSVFTGLISSQNNYKYRRLYELIAGSLLMVIIVTVLLGVVPHLHKLIIIKGINYSDLIGVISSFLGVASVIGLFIKSSSTKKGKIPTGLLMVVASIALLFGVLLIAYSIVITVNHTLYLALIAIIIILLIGLCVNLNYISLHRFYRDRLMESFMPNLKEVFKSELLNSEIFGKPNNEPNNAKLHDMCRINEGQGGPASNPIPYHIINTNIILVSSHMPKYRGRGGDNFILSPKYCGSDATSWVETSKFMDGRMTLATAMAISGAAVNPSTGVGGEGVTRQHFLSILMGLLNIRLGYWLQNPNPNNRPRPFSTPNFIFPGLQELLRFKTLNEEAEFVQLSDGGHFENLALYELIRRRLKLIIVCDGAADPEFYFGDLANAIEKVRTDFGVRIDITSESLKDLIPRKMKKDQNSMDYAKCGYLFAKIIYPDKMEGTLIYLKTTFFRKLSADLYGYRKDHPQFPDEPTSDQFFDENQFEAYRELGFQTVKDMVESHPINVAWAINYK